MKTMIEHYDGQDRTFYTEDRRFSSEKQALDRLDELEVEMAGQADVCSVMLCENNGATKERRWI